MLITKHKRFIPLTEKLTVNFMVLGLASILILGILSYRQHRRALIAQAVENITQKTNNWRLHLSRLVLETALNVDQSLYTWDAWHSNLQNITDSGFYMELSPAGNEMIVRMDHPPSTEGLSEIAVHDILSNPPSTDKKGFYLAGFRTIDSLTFEVKFFVVNRNPDSICTVLNIVSRITNSTMLPVYAAKSDFAVCLSGPHNRCIPLNPNASGLQSFLGDNHNYSTNGSSASQILMADGQPVLRIRLPLHTAIPGWWITGMDDARQLQKANASYLKQLIVISLLIAAVFFVFVYLTARSFVRPIRNLTLASLQTSYGNYIPVGDTTPNDETGELTQAFNQMTHRLRQQQEELGKERIRRLRAMIDSQESERKRVSRELHEGIAQDLAALKFTAGNMCKNSEHTTHRQTVHEIENLADRMIERIRQISNNLSPSVLGGFGLGAALRFLADETTKEHGIRVDIHTGGLPLRITGKLKTYLYRIVQESILNTLRHSEASRISVSFTTNDNFLDIFIEDNGKAFTPGEMQNPGYGLYNIRERVELLMGTLEVTTANDQGTKIVIRVPLCVAKPDNTGEIIPKRKNSDSNGS